MYEKLISKPEMPFLFFASSLSVKEASTLVWTAFFLTTFLYQLECFCLLGKRRPYYILNNKDIYYDIQAFQREAYLRTVLAT